MHFTPDFTEMAVATGPGDAPAVSSSLIALWLLLFVDMNVTT